MREVRDLRAACSSASNWKRIPLFLSNTHGRTRERHLWGALRVSAAFLSKPGASYSNRERMTSLVYPAEDVHRRLPIADDIGEIQEHRLTGARTLLGSASGVSPGAT